MLPMASLALRRAVLARLSRRQWLRHPRLHHPNLQFRFGVGELSAINGIAGCEWYFRPACSLRRSPSSTQLAFSEHVPVVHIVGTPNTLQLKTKPMLHHTLGDGRSVNLTTTRTPTHHSDRMHRFDAYQKAAEQFTISQAYLTRKENADVEIDRVLTDCLILVRRGALGSEPQSVDRSIVLAQGRPVYLSLPTDVAYERISAARLGIHLNREPPENAPDIEASVIESIYKLVKEADCDVVVLVDACTIRHRIKKELREFLDKTQLPVYATPMGKTAIDEDYPRYGGVCCRL